MRFKSFDRNIKGRDFIVGDIHGCYDHLHKLLNQVRFNQDEDRLFSVGDLADRGPQSYESLYFNGEAVMGNHEWLAIKYYEQQFTESFYVRNGGEWFVNMDRDQQSMLIISVVFHMQLK